MQKRKSDNLILFYLLMGAILFSANIVHPVTPAFLRSLHYPDYMFGLAYGLMCLGAFTLSPMWGKFGHKHGYIKTIALGAFMYAIGQAIFAFARVELLTAVGRLFSGIFTPALMQSQMLYLREHYGDKNLDSRIAFGAAVQVFAGAMGYLTGGYIGNHNVMLAFYLQIAISLLLSIVTIVFFKDSVHNSSKIELKEINPFKAFMDVLKIMNKEIATFYFLTAFCSFAFVSFDTTYNYYIKSIFNLPPIYNGVIRAIIGVSAFLLNISINRIIAKRCDIRKSIRAYLSMIIFLLLSIILQNNTTIFLVAALSYSIIDSLQKPLMQIIATSNALIFGGFTSVQYFGMVLGSFSAGWLYTINPKLPFISSILFVMLAIYIGFINQLEFNRNK